MQGASYLKICKPNRHGSKFTKKWTTPNWSS
jgi:hypothetical protein